MAKLLITRDNASSGPEPVYGLTVVDRVPQDHRGRDCRGLGDPAPHIAIVKGAGLLGICRAGLGVMLNMNDATAKAEDVLASAIGDFDQIAIGGDQLASVMPVPIASSDHDRVIFADFKHSASPGV